MKKWIYIELIIIFALIFFISGGLLLDYYIKDQKAEESYDELSNMVEQVRQEVQTATPNATTPEGEPVEIVLVEVKDPETGEIRKVLPEYAQLYTMNPDVIGWIRIPGTKVDYPVMHHPEKNDYYLKLDFYEKYSAAGSIYIREQCDPFAPSDNITIYGHRMNSGAMFGELMGYKEVEFWSENRYIYFDTLTERHTYEVFAVFRISASVNNGFQYQQYVDMTEEEFTEYVNQCKERALYNTGITAEYGDKLITLSTCEKGQYNMRVVIVAKRVE